MSADSKFAESLARLEHKVDVIMSMLLFLVRMKAPAALMSDKDVAEARVGSPIHKCPLCAEIVEYFVDPVDSVVVRKCACKTGKIAIDMKAFAPPAMPVPSKENSSGEQQEDRSNPRPRGSRPGGR